MKLGHPSRGTQRREGSAGGSDPQVGDVSEQLGSVRTYTKLLRIAELARLGRKTAFTSLAHHMDIAFLREAFARTRKDGATGVDGQTAQEYMQELEDNLRSLHERFKSGGYRAPPVRGAEIPKGNGKMRPLGIPTFEDKVLQRAVAMVLESIYEQDFLPSSHGFRPGRSAHGALDELWRSAMDMGGCWVLEVDIQSFFDTLDHGVLRAFLDRRVRDGVIRRAIDKWLKAGVLKDGCLRHRTEGTPQGGVISPLLANIYLHEVLDVWFEQDVKPRLHGQARLIRYADDFVILFTSAVDARRVFDVLPRRFGKFGLALHPEKTRLVEFRPPGDQGAAPARQRAPRTFDLLGFTHFWARARSGRWAVQRQTMRKRLTRAARAIREWCRDHRHEPLPEQHRALCAKVRGHAQYYGITGNYRALAAFGRCVERAWQRWLNRRDNARTMPWSRFRKLLARYSLPRPRVVHSKLRQRSEPDPPTSRMR
ncbi:MAG: group II intron reverse transcriptase/maturase [Planctomycetes bacterium]|nr:group II intron reverse transcriptase/maturase [Planctomycetota bacterium]